MKEPHVMIWNCVQAKNCHVYLALQHDIYFFHVKNIPMTGLNYASVPHRKLTSEHFNCSDVFIMQKKTVAPTLNFHDIVHRFKSLLEKYPSLRTHLVITFCYTQSCKEVWCSGHMSGNKRRGFMWVQIHSGQ